jgi:hypothetical protein
MKNPYLQERLDRAVAVESSVMSNPDGKETKVLTARMLKRAGAELDEECERDEELPERWDGMS